MKRKGEHIEIKSFTWELTDHFHGVELAVSESPIPGRDETLKLYRVRDLFENHKGDTIHEIFYQGTNPYIADRIFVERCAAYIEDD